MGGDEAAELAFVGLVGQGYPDVGKHVEAKDPVVDVERETADDAACHQAADAFVDRRGREVHGRADIR
ncbi:hypothetical protein N181_04040 [Sinorhizobium fredii USDA 205]|nr:hypothetical protein N181_04040 [Sinorhizobium fredii USDA 205]